MRTLRERFEQKFEPEPNTGCWLWTDFVRSDGYAVILHENRQLYVHRVSWQLYHGSIPDGICVLHRCDVRACVNPDHLFLGTHNDNTLDMIVKGRQSCGESRLASKLTSVQVQNIRAYDLHGTLNQCELAEKYHVAQANISRIILRQSWKHLN